MHTYKFSCPDNPSVEIQAENFDSALNELQGMDTSTLDGGNIVRDFHGPDGRGDLDDVTRDGEPLRNFWDILKKEI